MKVVLVLVAFLGLFQVRAAPRPCEIMMITKLIMIGAMAIIVIIIYSKSGLVQAHVRR